MQGSDMIGRARTGTGKTLAFGIPIMDKIIRFNEKHGFVQSAFSLGFYSFSSANMIAALCNVFSSARLGNFIKV